MSAVAARGWAIQRRNAELARRLAALFPAAGRRVEYAADVIDDAMRLLGHRAQMRRVRRLPSEPEGARPSKWRAGFSVVREKTRRSTADELRHLAAIAAGGPTRWIWCRAWMEMSVTAKELVRRAAGAKDRKTPLKLERWRLDDSSIECPAPSAVATLLPAAIALAKKAGRRQPTGDRLDEAAAILAILDWLHGCPARNRRERAKKDLKQIDALFGCEEFAAIAKSNATLDELLKRADQRR